MKTRLKLLAPALVPALALPLALGLAAPAAQAQDRGWSDYRQQVQYDRYERMDNFDRYQRRDQRGHAVIQRRIDQLSRDISNARRNGELGRRQVRSLYSQLDAIDRAYSAFARNGISRRDVRTVSWRIDQAYAALDRARYDRAARHDGYRGYGRRY